ncbi:MAG: efflux RND transporter periplasmic adaptor subunit [Candidatus Gastranaerophilaceae bacterium]
MKKALIIFGLLLIIFGGIYIFNHRHKKNLNELTLFGNIEIRQVDLSFRVEGKIKKMIVEEGDYVKKGELLGYLDDTNYKSTYEKNMADIQALTAISANTKSQYERNIPLCKDGTTSKQECDSLKNSKDSTKASLDASIASSKGAKKNLDDTRVYAPDNGIIMTRIQEPGAVVEPSQPIYTMAKTEPVWVRAYIPEPNLANVKYGMKAKVLTDTINPQTGTPREYTGWVGYISPVAEFTPKTVQTEDLRTDLVYRIRIYVYDIDEYLRQGMPVTVKIKLKG